MATDKLQKPSATELEILHVLWAHGPCTVREVHEVLARGKAIGYTTVLKIMQIMTQKGSVARNEESKAHVYKARLPAENTKRQLVGDLLQRAFAGSASQLMMHALAGKKTSQAEISEIRELLDEYERKAK